jgi:alpha-tubulin suppressor-like RCC1 family protein
MMQTISFWAAAVVGAVVLAQPVTVGPVTVGPVLAASSAAVGDGGVLGWGESRLGQLGTGRVSPNEATPVVSALGPGSGVVEVSGGAEHSLALRSDGSVLAWGNNYWGQLGNGETDNQRSEPVAVSGLGPGSAVVAVSAGGLHSLALRSDGTVLTWGSDVGQQQFGGGPLVAQPIPVVVSTLGPGSGIVAIAAGASHNLALRGDGSVVAWGIGGPLGDGGDVGRSTPVAVSGLGAGSGVVAIDAGEYHSIALRSDGSVLAWGDDNFGQLGNGESHENASTPVAVSGLGAGSGVMAITAGSEHNLAVRSGGSVVAWGNNTYGALGHEDPSAGTTPVPVSSLGAGSGVVAVAAGRSHSLALRSDGGVMAWGWDSNGQVGDVGDAPNRNRLAPVPVTGLGVGSGVRAISAGNYHSLALFGGEQGLSLVGADGGVFSLGTAGFFGSMAGQRLVRPVVGMEHTPTARGYWLVAADGGIFAFGDARFFGSTGGLALNRPIVAMERTPTGHGYWLVARDGGIFAFGDAPFFGSTGGIPLSQPIVGMERTPTGDGYWLVGADGGVFTFGAAVFHGSLGAAPGRDPIVGMARTNSAAGYHLLASDASVFGFGDGSDVNESPSVGRIPYVGITPAPYGDGYWLCARNGGVIARGSAQGLGSLFDVPLGAPIVGCHAPLNLSG